MSLFKNTPSKKSSLKTMIDTPISSLIDKTKSASESLSKKMTQSSITPSMTQSSNSRSPSFFTSSKPTFSTSEPNSLYSTLKEKSKSMITNFSFKSVLFWILMVIVLALLGLNIFKYLSEGTDFLAKIIAPITAFIATITGDTAKTTVSTASDGTQKIIEKTSDTARNVVDYSAQGTTKSISFLQGKIKKDDPAAAAIATATATAANENDEPINPLVADIDNINDNLSKKEKTDEPEPIQTAAQKQGYCYIGKINDTRYCAKVSGKAQCMSGDIYPSENLCINPNLRM